MSSTGLNISLEWKSRNQHEATRHLTFIVTCPGHVLEYSQSWGTCGAILNDLSCTCGFHSADVHGFCSLEKGHRIVATARPDVVHMPLIAAAAALAASMPQAAMEELLYLESIISAE